MTIRAVVPLMLVLGMWCSSAAGRNVVRCEVDGVTTFGETACAGGPTIAQAAPDAAGAARRQREHEEGCRVIAQFARQVADGRRVGVEGASVERATTATNAGLVAVAVRLYAVPLEELQKEVEKIERECRASKHEEHQDEE